ncbi:MAG: hypothetical protein ACKV2O_03335 [Acidimicrobiales bacterium]
MTGNTHPELPSGAADGGIGSAGNAAGRDELDHLSHLLQTLRGPAQPHELTRLSTVSAGMHAAVQQALHAMGDTVGDTTGDSSVAADGSGAGPTVAADPRERKHMLAKLITLKAVGIIGAGVLTVGTAAAATGVWPPPPDHSNASTTARDRVAELNQNTDEDEVVPEDTVIDTTEAEPDTDTTDSIPDSTVEDDGDTLPATDPADEDWKIDCPTGDDAPANHGEFVSSVAKNHENDELAGNHGAVVSDAARSDCGKPGQEDTTTDPSTDLTITPTAQPTEEPTKPGNGPPNGANPGNSAANGANNGKGPKK